MSWVLTKLASVLEWRSSSTLPSPGPEQDWNDSSSADTGSESWESRDSLEDEKAQGGYAGMPWPGIDLGTEEPMSPRDALSLLKAGNDRFAKGTSLAVRRNDVVRREFVDLDQAPHAAIVGCSDCQAPLETIFDSLPGDIFAFKNAGNTCIHANGSMVASLEFCADQLGCRLVLVLGHKRCGVLLDACKTYLEKQRPNCGDCALNGLLHDLGSVIKRASPACPGSPLTELGPGVVAELAERAVEENVFQTVELLLRFSETMRQKVRSGALEIQAAIFDEASGQVNFLGPSPMQEEILQCNLPVPPWPRQRGDAIVTLAGSTPMPEEAMEKLRRGNERYVAGTTLYTKAAPGRTAIADPFCAVLACADMRVPVDTVFDMSPGDIFVMRNAGNTCTHAAGSIMSSLEFSVTKFGTRLILVLGHTQCASITGAVRACMCGEAKPGRLSRSLTTLAKDAAAQIGEGAGLPRLSLCAVKLNVLQTMEIVLRHSKPIRALAQQGEVQVQGAVHHIESGCVEFLGPLLNEDEVLGRG
mmetsp:Transcript_64231/g.150813  ORF Transcript_64231/g.150813 Transcript_64231/m.150813 type:complete len:530 (-) Transcript_64231:93-1682(-)